MLRKRKTMTKAIYMLLSPAKEMVSFDSLRKFCDQKGLDRHYIMLVLKGERAEYKGWTRFGMGITQQEIKNVMCVDCQTEYYLDDALRKHRIITNARCKKCQADKANQRVKKYQDKHKDSYLSRKRLLRTGDANIKVFALDEKTNLKKFSRCKELKDKAEYSLNKQSHRPFGKCSECRSEVWFEKMSDPKAREEERKRVNALQKKIRETPQGRIDSRVSNAIWYALRSRKSFRHWYDLVGYSARDLKEHLEKLFTEGMSWELFLEGKIHIDHRIPKSWFQYESEQDKEFKKCWALDNLQPKWAKDNLRKHARYAD